MSFDWNLSSDEEDLEEWTRKAGFQQNHDHCDGDDDDGHKTKVCSTSQTVTPSPFASLAKQSFEQGVDSNSEEEEDNDDGVDWEDAENDKQDQKPAATSTFELRTVNIDLNSKAGEQTTNCITKNAIKRKRRNKFRVESLPRSMQSLLWNLHRSHLLALTSHAVYVSQICSDPQVLAVALSLIPVRWSLCRTAKSTREVATTTSPTLSELRSFLEWYFDLIHGVTERRQWQQVANRAAGAPYRRGIRRRRGQANRAASAPERGDIQRRYGKTIQANNTSATSESSTILPTSTPGLLAFASYLSRTNDEDPQLLDADEIDPNSFHASDQLYVELLLSMFRSLGWRARFVQSMEPMTPDLDVNHPLLASLCGNIVAALWKDSRDTKSPMKKRKRSTRPFSVVSASTENKTLPLPIETGSARVKKEMMGWVEILCSDPSVKSKHRWVHVDPFQKLVNQPEQVELLLERNSQWISPNNQITKRGVVAFVLGVEHCLLHQSSGEEVTRLRLTDVTPRYAESWIASLRKRGIVRGKKCSIEEKVRKSWWSKSLQDINDAHRPDFSMQPQPTSPAILKLGSSKEDAIILADNEGNDKKPAAVFCEQTDTLDSVEQHETEELEKSASIEAIPTSKAGFKSHPLYAIPSVLGNAEVLTPDASKRICGVYKGELVYRRTDVSTALTANKWLYEGRKVRERELSKPVKRKRVRYKPASKSFKALRSYGVGESNVGNRQQQIEDGSKPLEDGMENVYGKWQTDPWSPAPVNPNDEIPVNEYKNIELALLNPGLVHIDQGGLGTVAKKLGIPYAPCLLGFEGHGGNRTPTVCGIVVHQHNEELIRAAGVEVASHAIEQEHNDRRQAILLRWKRLMVGLLTKARLDREYGSESE